MSRVCLRCAVHAEQQRLLQQLHRSMTLSKALSCRLSITAEDTLYSIAHSGPLRGLHQDRQDGAERTSREEPTAVHNNVREMRAELA